jgi:hypothetical protein
MSTTGLFKMYVCLKFAAFNHIISNCMLCKMLEMIQRHETNKKAVLPIGLLLAAKLVARAGVGVHAERWEMSRRSACNFIWRR